MRARTQTHVLTIILGLIIYLLSGILSARSQPAPLRPRPGEMSISDYKAMLASDMDFDDNCLPDWIESPRTLCPIRPPATTVAGTVVRAARVFTPDSAQALLFY